MKNFESQSETNLFLDQNLCLNATEEELKNCRTATLTVTHKNFTPKEVAALGRVDINSTEGISHMFMAYLTVAGHIAPCTFAVSAETGKVYLTGFTIGQERIDIFIGDQRTESSISRLSAIARLVEDEINEA